MPDPADPPRTTATWDTHPPASGDRGEPTATPTPGGAAAPRFGPPAAAGEVGTLGPYRVLGPLGKGGMGAVYLALDTRLDRPLALKVMLPEVAADADARARFLREARAAAGVSHDNVVTVYEADERDGVPYIAMQLLRGRPLDRLLAAEGAPALADAVRIARETALGLAAAHERGLVHRDVKPANLWLEAPGGRVKVLDFGLAKPAGADAGLTRSGAVLGTPAYMSPEQARGPGVDHRTDLFSLGAVLYRLCTGQNPFAGGHAVAVLAAVLADDPAPVRDLNPDVPEPLARLIHQLLAKEPADRPQTAGEVAERLRPVPDRPAAPAAAGPPVPAAPGGVPAPVPAAARPGGAPAGPGAGRGAAAPAPGRAAGGKGWAVAAGAAVLLAVVAGVAVSRLGGGKGTGAQPPAAGAAGGDGTGAGPKGPAGPAVPPPTFRNGVGMEFVRVPKGTAWLGGGARRPGDTEAAVGRDFYLGRCEVTQGEWEAVTGLTPSVFGRGSEAVKGVGDADLRRFPVENVSWDDCQAFIGLLNGREKEAGWAYRLPTEAEWEYACRGGPADRADSAFDFYLARPANTLPPGRANFECGGGRALNRPCEVGSFEGNSLGLKDMHGNVWEWCADAAAGPGGAPLRVSRGGHWSSGPQDCRAAGRGADPPSHREGSLGLRLARVPAGR